MPPVRVLIAAALLLVGVGAWLLAGAASPRPALEASQDAAVNAGAGDLTDLTAHNSPTLARNPTDDANFVIANRVDAPQFSCALHVSDDAGATWAASEIPTPQGGQATCHTPDAAFGADGVLYVVFTTLVGEDNVPSAVWLATSDDGGQSLSEPVKLVDELAFHSRLAVQPSSPDQLHLTWLQAGDVDTFGFPEAGYPIQAMHSDDGGQTWSTPVQVNDPERARVVAPTPAVGPDGTAYVAYLDLGKDALDYHGEHEGRGGPAYGGNWELVVARDDDGDWVESVVDDGLVPSERILVFLPDHPALAVDQDSGRVYAGFHDARDGDRDVRVWTSRDGSRWSRPRVVNDTPADDATSQYLAQLDVASTGRLDVAYYDRRDDPDDVMTEVSLQSSVDHGRIFAERVTLSSEAFDSRIGLGSERNLADLGSRLGLLATPDHALAVWADTRSATPASNKQDLYRAAVRVSGADRPGVLVHALPYLPAAGAVSVLAGVVLIATWARPLRRGRR